MKSKEPLDGFTLDLLETVHAQLDQIEALLKRQADLYGGKETPELEPLKPDVADTLAQWIGPLGKRGARKEIVRDLYVSMVFQSCLNELPKIAGSVNRALKMTQDLLDRRDISMSVPGIRASLKNVEIARSQPLQSYLFK